MRKIIASLAFVVVAAVSCTKPQDLEFIDIGNIHVVKMGLKESEGGLDVR